MQSIQSNGDWPTVAVIIPTYKRPKILVRCLEALIENLIYTGPILFFIGIDGGWDETLARVLRVIPRLDMVVIEGPRLLNDNPEKVTGLGANLNKLIRCARQHNCELLFQMDDDHILTKPLVLDKHVEHLMADEGAGWIRLMGIASHTYIAVLFGKYWYLQWKIVGDYGLYITSNRPHLKHVRFHDYYGMYPEGRNLGDTEITFCHHCFDVVKQRGAGPAVLVPLQYEHEDGWDHVGQSWQGRE